MPNDFKSLAAKYEYLIKRKEKLSNPPQTDIEPLILSVYDLVANSVETLVRPAFQNVRCSLVKYPNMNQINLALPNHAVSILANARFESRNWCLIVCVPPRILRKSGMAAGVWHDVMSFSLDYDENLNPCFVKSGKFLSLQEVADEIINVLYTELDLRITREAEMPNDS